MKNFISIEVLEAQGLEFIGKDGVLKMLKGSIIVLKGIRRNNFYYLKDNIVTGQLTNSVSTYDDFD